MCKATLTAFCWSSGIIEFGTSVPEGALPIITGPADLVTSTIEATSRHAHDEKTFLVPGVPEADSDASAVDALKAYVNWLEQCRQKREDRQCKR